MLSKLKKFLYRFDINVNNCQNEEQIKQYISKIDPQFLTLLTTPKNLCEIRSDRIFNYTKNMKFDYFDYLDVGCGNSITTKYISSTLGVWGFGIDVVDLTTPLLKDNEFSFEKCDGKHIPYSDNTFKIITVINVLHHIFYLGSFLKELNRVLKKDGVLYIEEMCISDNVTHDDIHFMHKVFGCEQDIYPRTYEEWNDIISYNGFSMENFGEYKDEYNTNYIFYIKL